MRFVALAADYDGTLAHDGVVGSATVDALSRLRASGRRLILVTGRQLPELLAILPAANLFDLIVAENGALLYHPTTRREQLLAEPPPAELIRAIEGAGVAPLAVGRVILATWHPHEAAVLDAIQALGLEHQVIFNKGAVMVLPPAVNKGTGLHVALRALGLSPLNAVAIGDAENDHAMFTLSGCAVAVRNALPMVKRHADVVTRGDHGTGVVELIDRLLADDLRGWRPLLRRHRIPLGRAADGCALHLPPYGLNLLIAGPPASGKSTILKTLVERLLEAGHQCCLIDPEGDHDAIPGAVVLGSCHHPPDPADVEHVMAQSESSGVVCLLGVPMAARPAVVADIVGRVAGLRARLGRPHWLLIDEAHHVLPRLDGDRLNLSDTMLVTLDPAELDPAALARIDLLIATDNHPRQTIASLCAALGEPAPPSPADAAGEEVVVWPRRSPATVRVRVPPPRTPHRRHRRKYARGEIEPSRSFFFRGPDRRVQERAANLDQFVRLAETVDDDVWLFHLRRGDYARWFRDVIRDDELSGEIERLGCGAAPDPRASRSAVREAIERRYVIAS